MRHWSLQKCLNLYQKKYRADIGHVLRCLVLFDDADREPHLNLLTDIRWNRVKTDFENWVDAIISQ